jgi:streptogramin lyase
MLRKLIILASAALALAAGSAGAAPLGAITEFSAGMNPGGNPAQVVAGSDGNLWFSDRSGASGGSQRAGRSASSAAA